MTRNRASGRSAGFTLLETLVALAILGIVMATVYAVIGSGLRAAHRDEDRLLLGLVAQNLLVRSRLDLDPKSGELSGDIGGGLRWHIESEPYAIPEDILPEAPTALDEPLLSSRDKETGSTTGGSGGLGGRSAMAEEGRGGLGQAQSDTATTGAETPAIGSDERTTRPAVPREPLRLRLIRVTVEKGDQRFQLSTLALEPSDERRTLR